MGKLPSFIEARKKNWNYLRENLDQFSEFLNSHYPLMPSHGVLKDLLGIIVNVEPNVVGSALCLE